MTTDRTTPTSTPIPLGRNTEGLDIDVEVGTWQREGSRSVVYTHIDFSGPRMVADGEAIRANLSDIAEVIAQDAHIDARHADWRGNTFEAVGISSVVAALSTTGIHVDAAQQHALDAAITDAFSRYVETLEEGLQSIAQETRRTLHSPAPQIVECTPIAVPAPTDAKKTGATLPERAQVVTTFTLNNEADALNLQQEITDYFHALGHNEQHIKLKYPEAPDGNTFNVINASSAMAAVALAENLGAITPERAEKALDDISETFHQTLTTHIQDIQKAFDENPLLRASARRPGSRGG